MAHLKTQDLGRRPACLRISFRLKIKGLPCSRNCCAPNLNAPQKLVKRKRLVERQQIVTRITHQRCCWCWEVVGIWNQKHHAIETVQGKAGRGSKGSGKSLDEDSGKGASQSKRSYIGVHRPDGTNTSHDTTSMSRTTTHLQLLHFIAMVAHEVFSVGSSLKGTMVIDTACQRAYVQGDNGWTVLNSIDFAATRSPSILPSHPWIQHGRLTSRGRSTGVDRPTNLQQKTCELIDAAPSSFHAKPEIKTSQIKNSDFDQADSA